MPLTSSVADVISVVTLLLVFLICVIGAFCLAYVLHFHYKVRRDRLLALRDFDSPWAVRTVLIGFTVIWGLDEVLRLPLLRERGWPLHNLDFVWQANLCRFHIVSSLGLLEPGFFLTSLFLVHVSLQNGIAFSSSLNARVFPSLAIFCLPFLMLQSLVVVTSSVFQFNKGYNAQKEGFGGVFPSYFTRSFQVELDETGTRLAVCTYPLFSVILLGLFSVIFVGYFSYLGARMLHLVINRKLRMRVFVLIMVVAILFPLHTLLLGLSAHMKASKAGHAISTFVGFLTLFICTSVGEWILVFQPVADAVAVRGVFENNRWQSFGESQVEPFGRPLSAFVSDEEEGLQLARITLLGQSVSSTAVDVESSSKEGSISFDTMLKDITFGPGNRLAEVIASVTSPELPGKPSTSSHFV